MYKRALERALGKQIRARLARLARLECEFAQSLLSLLHFSEKYMNSSICFQYIPVHGSIDVQIEAIPAKFGTKVREVRGVHVHEMRIARHKVSSRLLYKHMARTTHPDPIHLHPVAVMQLEQIPYQTSHGMPTKVG
jgi:hypothetical protein